MRFAGCMAPIWISFASSTNKSKRRSCQPNAADVITGDLHVYTHQGERCQIKNTYAAMNHMLSRLNAGVFGFATVTQDTYRTGTSNDINRAIYLIQDDLFYL